MVWARRESPLNTRKWNSGGISRAICNPLLSCWNLQACSWLWRTCLSRFPRDSEQTRKITLIFIRLKASQVPFTVGVSESPSGAGGARPEAASLGFMRSPPKVSVREPGSQPPLLEKAVSFPLQAAHTPRVAQGSWVWGNLFLLHLMKYCDLFFPVLSHFLKLNLPVEQLSDRVNG